ncbi:MAG: phosphoglycerate dehydrogenase [Verrucomicrobiaceae bacterium]|nr:phosphoglycerate dehydrogenase [Verrucomicrobiaceae bacterium]
MSKFNILIAGNNDPISSKGIDLLKAEPSFSVTVNMDLKAEDKMIEASRDAHAIIVRSGAKVTAKVLEAAPNLKVVGRAGVGVDNIDVPVASKRGVVVMNTPGGNTISTAEQAFTLMMALSRKTPQAHATIVSGKWDRKSFQGTEVFGKTLVVLGMGRIGAEFAKRAKAFGMSVIAYDPYLSKNRAESLGVTLCEDLDAAIVQADYITMHMPLTPETKHMINAKRLASLKKSCRIINCARGGLIDDAALAQALTDGTIAGAALDVFETEPPPADYPLLKAPNTVFTPHLGASTEEAQENVGIEIAEVIKAHLLQGTVVNAVNMPNVDPKVLAEIGPFLKFGELLGRLVSQLAPARSNVVRINYSGKVGGGDTTLISRAVLKGFLERPVGAEQVNYINASGVAENLGLRFTESRLPGAGEFTDLIEVIAKNDAGESASISGTFFAGAPRIVKVNGRHIEARPEGTLLFIENIDRPGMIAAYSATLGKNQVNIADMSLSRDKESGKALTLLTLDSCPGAEVLAELEKIQGISKVHCVAV